jgi:hypothetical protein
MPSDERKPLRHHQNCATSQTCTACGADSLPNCAVYRSRGVRLSRAVESLPKYRLRIEAVAVLFMDDDLGYFDLETRVIEPLENPFGPKVLRMS